MIEAHIVYSGRVQGVGFRYTVQSLARPLKICGWVKNLADGRVEIRTQGSKEKIEQLIQEIDDHFDRGIKEKAVSWLEVKESCRDFQIVF